MAELVYLLCALASIGCAGLLLRQYRRARTQILFWSGLCFVGFSINNAILVLDQVFVPQVDLSLLRNAIALVALMVLVFGLIWESR